MFCRSWRTVRTCIGVSCSRNLGCVLAFFLFPLSSTSFLHLLEFDVEIARYPFVSPRLVSLMTDPSSRNAFYCVQDGDVMT